MIPYAYAKAHGVVVTSLHEVGEVAVRGDAQAGALAELRRALGVPLRARRVADAEFDELIAAAYNGAAAGAAALADDLSQDVDLARLLQEIPKIADLLDSQDDAPVIRLINALLTQALRDGASDIHFEAFESRSVVRLRIDGTLRDLIEPARALHGAIVSRLKIMAQLDIAEKRLPQDGRIALRVAGKPVDVRVSTIPTGHGERVVLRLLDQQAGRLDLAQLGMDDATLAHMDRLIKEPHGIVLVTGPTGSGKTTTLYAALSRLDTTALNIMTVEDPIEYDLDGISQTPINARIDMSFARALRTILRQDPDVVMIGEIRDLETAQIAVQASLTGHLVLSTLHTNTAAGAITRLRDMGIEPFLLSSSLIGVLAQRLVRVLSPESKQAYQASDYERRLLNVPPGAPSPTLYRPGRDASGGYRGRTGIYELIVVDETMRTMIHDGVSEQEIERHARAATPSIRDDGRAKVLRGETTLEEVLRVTRED
ncbi:MAG TPA: type II secretion system ATPase GspE [Steroidobacteraceae bacterium]|nr:type II secretion system ATPase GspE [Steroidobacteraceae bacterium]